MSNLNGKTAIVTGASKGIGAAIVQALGAAGAYVIAHYGHDAEGVKAAVGGIEQSDVDQKTFVAPTARLRAPSCPRARRMAVVCVAVTGAL